ncbi:hypothetical protein GCM10023205_00980 [Yinghuangia aomiensis]|uniref:PPE family protein n=1 Tax=Yinghuangia aomiensis TaxID=676205 RepID=A0ABP9GKT7_9ACTN
MATDFSRFTHQQLIDMVAHVNHEDAAWAALRLAFVGEQLKQAATTLNLKLADSRQGWTGATADSFHTWADAVTESTHQLSQYSTEMGKQLGHVASAAGTAGSMPQLPTTEMATVETVKAMAAPTELDAIGGVNAATYVELQRQEAITTMNNIAKGYNDAAMVMDGSVPPEYPPPANIYNVASYENSDLDGPGGGSNRASGTGSDAAKRGAAGGSAEGTSRGGTGVSGRVQPTNVVAADSGGAAPATLPPTGVELTGNGTLHADQPSPLTTVGSPPSGPGDLGKYGSPIGVPPMGGSPLQLPSAGKPGALGEAGNPGSPVLGRPGVSGGKAVNNPREVAPSASPRGVPGNTLRAGPIEGGTPMRGPGLSPGESPQGVGRGGMPVSGGTAGPSSGSGRTGTPRSSVRTPGGTVGGEPTGGVGGRSFSRGGSGIRVTPPEGAHPGEASPTGRAMPNSSASPTRQDRRRRQRAEYLEEDESTWTAHGQPVPPVVD